MIVERGRDRVLYIDDVIMAKLIQRLRGNARLDVCLDHIQDPPQQAVQRPSFWRFRELLLS